MSSRRSPDLATIVARLAEHGVSYVIAGSTAAMLRGVALEPGDLDIVPALDRDNLGRLAAALAAIDARPDPEAPFGEWQRSGDGWRWVSRDPKPGEREARAAWQPDATDAASFDRLLVTPHGALDVVPLVAGAYEDLIGRATPVAAFGGTVWVESVDDLLATLTVPRRARDTERVRALRAIRRAAHGPSTGTSPAGRAVPRDRDPGSMSATLAGDHIVLRSLLPADRPRLREILAQAEVASRWLGSRHLDEALDELFVADDHTPFAITFEGVAVGYIQYAEEADPDYRSASIDVFLDRDFHGRGLGSDAVRTLARHLVDDRGHRRLTIDPATSNERAIGAYRRAGFRPVGVMRGYERGPDGTWHDNLLMDLLAEHLG